jgi:hypothetical protein
MSLFQGYLWESRNIVQRDRDGAFLFRKVALDVHLCGLISSTWRI